MIVIDPFSISQIAQYVISYKPISFLNNHPNVSQSFHTNLILKVLDVQNHRISVLIFISF